MPNDKVIHLVSPYSEANNDILSNLLEVLFSVNVLNFVWDVDELEEEYLEGRLGTPVLVIFSPPLRPNHNAEIWQRIKEVIPEVPALWLSPDLWEKEMSFLPVESATFHLLITDNNTEVARKFIDAVASMTGITPKFRF